MYDDDGITWTEQHQKLWDKLEAVDPVTPEGQRRYAERQSDLARAEVSRAHSDAAHDVRNVRARLAGAVTAARRRMAPTDPAGLGAGWGAMAREHDRGERFTPAARDYWMG